MSRNNQRPSDVINERLWTVNEVADYLGVTVSCLHGWRYKRTGPPAAVIGGKLRYRSQDVRGWVDHQFVP